ncbi:MAG: hypothetical protein E7474_13550 [Ruminococcaceae bacterium]|nr:hypothetical protein [Oscillospiraceae bacterium]
MAENKPPVTPTDAHWDAVEALLPLLGREKEWEVSRDRHHQRCLWDREEDAPFLWEEALCALRGALEKPLAEYDLPAEQLTLLEELLG